MGGHLPAPLQSLTPATHNQGKLTQPMCGLATFTHPFCGSFQGWLWGQSVVAQSLQQLCCLGASGNRGKEPWIKGGGIPGFLHREIHSRRVMGRAMRFPLHPSRCS